MTTIIIVTTYATVYLIKCHTPGIIATMIVEKSLEKPAAKLVAKYQWQ